MHINERFGLDWHSDFQSGLLNNRCFEDVYNPDRVKKFPCRSCPKTLQRKVHADSHAKWKILHLLLLVQFSISSVNNADDPEKDDKYTGSLYGPNLVWLAHGKVISSCWSCLKMSMLTKLLLLFHSQASAVQIFVSFLVCKVNKTKEISSKNLWVSLPHWQGQPGSCELGLTLGIFLFLNEFLSRNAYMVYNAYAFMARPQGPK